MTTDQVEAPLYKPIIRNVAPEQPWTWLSAGWRDMWRAPQISLAYGIAFSVVSAALTAGLFFSGMAYLLLPLSAGFLLLGPMLAVGMYEASRRLETGQPMTLGDVMFVKTRSPTQLAFLGVLLMLFMLAWVRIATLLFALFMQSTFPPVDQWVSVLLFTPNGLGLLIVGGIIGGVLAVIVFALTAISVPMLMVHDVDTITAMVASVNAVRQNLWPMLLWGWLIALLTAVGIATLFVGLAVTFPLVGHATWHAYRSLVENA
ncbi:MAG: DUF2189 domain-containing protein [Minwuiales bacterium]|nr:DUF2189 domain-containing protein [Minwuiales bacterium]